MPKDKETRFNIKNSFERIAKMSHLKSLLEPKVYKSRMLKLVAKMESLRYPYKWMV